MRIIESLLQSDFMDQTPNMLLEVNFTTAKYYSSCRGDVSLTYPRLGSDNTLNFGDTWTFGSVPILILIEALVISTVLILNTDNLQMMPKADEQLCVCVI